MQDAQPGPPVPNQMPVRARNIHIDIVAGGVAPQEADGTQSLILLDSTGASHEFVLARDLRKTLRDGMSDIVTASPADLSTLGDLPK